MVSFQWTSYWAVDDLCRMDICSCLLVKRMGELQRFQKFIYLHLITNCFMKMSPQSSGPTQLLLSTALCAAIWEGK